MTGRVSAQSAPQTSPVIIVHSDQQNKNSKNNVFMQLQQFHTALDSWMATITVVFIELAMSVVERVGGRGAAF